MSGLLPKSLFGQTLLILVDVLQWADEEQKQRFLVPQARGEKFGTFALTEPNAGSDAGSIESTVWPVMRSIPLAS